MYKFLKRARIGLIGWIYVLWCHFTWVIPYSNHPERYPLELRYKRARKLVSFIVRHLAADVRLSGKAGLDGDAKLYVCNHVNTFDPLFLVAFSPKPIRFVSKIENYKMPFAGRILRVLGSFFIDRDDPRQAIRIFQQAEATIKSNEAHVCIFPEGTRNRTPREHTLREFHPGSLKIAQKAKASIVPVSIFGTDTPLDSSPIHRRYLVQYRFFDPIGPEIFLNKKTPEIALELHDLIEKEFLSEREIEKLYYQNKEYKNKKEAKWWLDKAIVPDYEK